MKISKITIKQLFGIKEWQGDGKNIELVGDNGTGKTSVIDAIRYALTNSSDREFIVKNGETEGEIYIETDNGLSIDRKARTAMTDYKSVKQNGNVIPSPESFLKTIFTPLQLSPMEFISMDKKTQNATILDMIQYDWNLDTIKEWFGEIPRDVNYEQNILAVLNDIQAENGYYFMHRQDVNRDIRAKKAVIADIGSSLPIDYDGERWEKENLSELYTEIEKIRKNNETIEKAKRLRDSHDGKIRSFQADKEIKIAALDTEMAQQEKNIESELAQLEERIKALREKKDGLAGVKADKVKVIQSEYEASVQPLENGQQAAAATESVATASEEAQAAMNGAASAASQLAQEESNLGTAGQSAAAGQTNLNESLNQANTNPANRRIQELIDQINKYKATVSGMESGKIRFDTGQYEEAVNGLRQAQEQFKQFKETVSQSPKNMEDVAKSIKSIGDAAQKCGLGTFSSILSGIASILPAIETGGMAANAGFQSMAVGLEAVQAAIPIIGIILTILTAIINAVRQVANAVKNETQKIISAVKTVVNKIRSGIAAIINKFKELKKRVRESLGFSEKQSGAFAKKLGSIIRLGTFMLLRSMFITYLAEMMLRQT